MMMMVIMSPCLKSNDDDAVDICVNVCLFSIWYEHFKFSNKLESKTNEENNTS